MNDRLEFDSVEISFGGRTVLSSIYMICEKGKITGLLGRNGCGKTTLMQIVFGAYPYPQKSIRINGTSLGMNYLSRKVIAYLPHSDFIPGYLTLRKALCLFDVAPDLILEDFPEFEGMMDMRPSQLSGGYLRIFEVLLVLRSRADFCLLDEPFTGLTPVFIDRVKQVFTRAKDSKGLVITDHLHRHVVEISGRLYLLANGQTYHVTNVDQLVSLGYVHHV